MDGDVRIQLVTSAYVYSAAHDFFNDVGAGSRLGTVASLAGKTFTAGVFNAASLSYTGVAAASVVAGCVGYLWTGAEGTSRLIWFEDRNADGIPMAFTADGNPITISWPLGQVFSI